MLKIGIKRRRTKAQIENDKQEEILREQDQQVKLAELADLRRRIELAEHTATTNKAAGIVISQMMSKGHLKLGENDSVILTDVNGEHSFGVNLPKQDQFE